MSRRTPKKPELGRVLVLGAGNVGTALFRGLRQARQAVELRALRRRGVPAHIDAELVLLCARDPALDELAHALRDRVSAQSAVVHVAGALDASVLEPLRGHCAGIGQAHPLLSFATQKFAPELTGAHVLVSGDRVAVRRARALCRILGMIPRTWAHADLSAYHAAAALCANGSVALAAGAARLLEASGCPRPELGRVLGPLLRSVAENVERLGLPGALTGPVRRGDAGTVRRHLSAIARYAPDIRNLYHACAVAQLGMARELGDATKTGLEEIERMLVSRR